MGPVPWRPAAVLLVAAAGVAAPAAAQEAAAQEAAAQVAAPGIPAAHEAQAVRAQEMVDRLEGGDKTAPALAAARALLEECLAAGNHRSAEFLAGHIVAAFPDQLRDRHRFVEVLLLRGSVDRAAADLRELVKERPTDCTAYGMLAELLVAQGRPAEALAVQEAHLKEHQDEAGPLFSRASIALWEMRDAAAARAAATRMREAADGKGLRTGVADWLRERARFIEEKAAALEKQREILGSASRRLDRVLWATMFAGVLALGAAGWMTRRRTA